MVSTRMLGVTVMCLLAQALGNSVSANPLGDALSRLPIYLCQFGDTLHAYAFRQGSDDSWTGLGQLQGWNVTVQSDGLVARKGDDVLILGKSGASLVEQGHLVTGQCADPRAELAQLFASDDVYQTLLGDIGSEEAARLRQQAADLSTHETALPNAEPQLAPNDPAAGDMSSFIDPTTWDEEKVAALIDALTLDDPARLSLKDQLRAAGRDPSRIDEVARLIRRALVANIAPTAQLRAKLKEANRNLDAATAALGDERQVAQNVAARLADSETRATAAERISNRTAAQYADAQSALRQQDVALKRATQETAVLHQQLTTVQGQAQQLQGALAEATRLEQAAYAQIDTMSAQLADMKARLVRANKKIDDLKAGGN